MNLIWALLQTHRGSIQQLGSLSHFFAILEKVRLGSDRPDYHTLLAALTQILEGLTLNAWRTECAKDGHATLNDFAQSDPTPEEVIKLAHTIIAKYAVPDENLPLTTTPKCKEAPLKSKQGNAAPPTRPQQGSDESSGTEETYSDIELENLNATTGSNPSGTQLETDHVHSNVVLLTRDLFYIVELVDAISSGDFGRIEDILSDLACLFRGAGSNNYSTEILHLLFNVKEVWTPEFANIMRDIMLVNPTGIPGHAMGIDLNIEHLIRYLKVSCSIIFVFVNYVNNGNTVGLVCGQRHLWKLGPAWKHIGSYQLLTINKKTGIRIAQKQLPRINSQKG